MNWERFLLFIQLLSQTPNLLENPGRYGGLLSWYNFIQSRWTIISSRSGKLADDQIARRKRKRASLDIDVTVLSD